MKTKIPFLALLFISTACVVGCGDNKDPRMSDDDIMCIKVQKYGGSCAPGGGGSGGNTTSTVQTTSTVTVTQSSTTY